MNVPHPTRADVLYRKAVPENNGIPNSTCCSPIGFSLLSVLMRFALGQDVLPRCIEHLRVVCGSLSLYPLKLAGRFIVHKLHASPLKGQNGYGIGIAMVEDEGRLCNDKLGRGSGVGRNSPTPCAHVSPI